MITNQSALLIIDAQEKITNPIEGKGTIIKNIKILLDAYESLEENIYISEQIPKKLGKTIPNLLPTKKFKLFEKVDFSLGTNSEFINDLNEKKIKNLIICGFETHICVQQTVIDLLNCNFKIYIVVDAMGSRNAIDHQISLKRMFSEGAIISTSESIIFELCKTSSREEFKSISNIIKNK
tara:strand:+ start:18149 stop:18688 length:540 start_codon:yes stop_codon:yes gene_type:complete